MEHAEVELMLLNTSQMSLNAKMQSTSAGSVSITLRGGHRQGWEMKRKVFRNTT